MSDRISGANDPAVQLLSGVHRAALWFSPMSWFLDRRLVREAEEASDDAAVESAGDRAFYARVLLEFMQRGVRRASWLGVPMARYGRPEERIHRILDGKTLPRRVTRWSVAAILGLGLPLAYLAAAAGPPEISQPEAVRAKGSVHDEAPAVPLEAPNPSHVYVMALGSVAATTVTVKPRVDGELMSVNFKEGDLVQTGQLLVTIDPHPYQLRLAQAEGQLARDQAQLSQVMGTINSLPRSLFDSNVAQAEGGIKTDQARVDEAKLELSYTQIASPITGVAGLRMVDPGNIVRASDSIGIVIINQLRPIAVLFSIPEDLLPQVLSRMRDGPAAEAWSRDGKVKYAAGRLTAVDNQIDTATGTVKLKAVFDNKDGALFPNQFVNVRLILNVNGR
jgi:multidrug efflux system membrane fusion protein